MRARERAASRSRTRRGRKAAGCHASMCGRHLREDLMGSQAAGGHINGGLRGISPRARGAGEFHVGGGDLMHCQWLWPLTRGVAHLRAHVPRDFM